MYNIINIYTFDHRTGLPRGQTGPMLYLTDGPTPESAKEIASVTENRDTNTDKQTSQQEETKPSPNMNKGDDHGRELRAAGKGNGKGKGKVCWECGEQGNFQRSCLKFGKDQNITGALNR